MSVLIRNGLTGNNLCISLHHYAESYILQLVFENRRFDLSIKYQLAFWQLKWGEWADTDLLCHIIFTPSVYH